MISDKARKDKSRLLRRRRKGRDYNVLENTDQSCVWHPGKLAVLFLALHRHLEPLLGKGAFSLRSCLASNCTRCDELDVIVIVVVVLLTLSLLEASVSACGFSVNISLRTVRKRVMVAALVASRRTGGGTFDECEASLVTRDAVAMLMRRGASTACATLNFMY
jgi:hypothetical protein